MAGLHGSSVCDFLKNCHPVLLEAAPCYSPAHSARGFQLLHILAAIHTLF